MTRPCNDIQTQYLNVLAGELIKEIKEVGEHKVIDLNEEKANRNSFEKAIDKRNPRLVILHGHGSIDCVWGQNEIILDKNNIQKMNSRIIYALVCDSLHELGRFAIENGGAEAYIGYESHYMITLEPTRSTTPLKDKSFRPFRDLHVMLVLLLISGFSVSEAVEKTKKRMNEFIREYGIRGIRDQYGDAPLIRFALYWNKFFMSAYGNLDAKF